MGIDETDHLIDMTDDMAKQIKSSLAKAKLQEKPKGYWRKYIKDRKKDDDYISKKHIRRGKR